MVLDASSKGFPHELIPAKLGGGGLVTCFESKLTFDPAQSNYLF